MQAVQFEDFLKLHLVVGTILSCEAVEGSSKLYKLQVNLGSYGERLILAGVANRFKKEDLIGNQAIFVANLPPRQIMGLTSEGMMLIAKDSDGNMQTVRPAMAVKDGARLS